MRTIPFIQASLALALATTLLQPFHLVAQAVTGTILGSVQDTAGASIPAALVVIKNTETGLERQTRSDQEGAFSFPSIPPGRYRVAAEVQGFRRAEMKDVALSVDQRARVDFRLEVGAVSDSVEVAAAIPLVQSDSSELGTTVSESQIRELPLNGRNFVQMTRLIPGVQRGIPGSNSDGGSSAAWRASASFAANGMRARDNNFILDGVDNNELLLSTVVVFPSPDALQEFKVQTSTYSAEFGRALGGVVNLQVKSGSNAWHGNLFEFLRNDKLDANDWFNNKFARPRAPYRQNQFGGTLGGPIIRNRTFFFMDYQGLRVRESRTFLSTVPSPRMRQGDFGEINLTIYDPLSRTPFPNNTIPSARIDPVSRKIVDQLYPIPNNAGQRSAIGQSIQNYFLNPASPRQDDQFDVKVDHQLTARNQMFGRVSYQRSARFLPAALPAGDAGNTSGAGDSLIDAYSLAFNDTHTFSPSLLNEFRFGATRFVLQGTPIGYQSNAAADLGIPGVNINDFSTAFTQIVFSPGDLQNIGPSPNQPILAYYNTYQWLDNLTWIKGKHTVKGGFSVIRRQRNQLNVNFPTGQFSFQRPITGNCGGVQTTCSPSATSGFAAATFMLGYPTVINRDTRLGMTGEWKYETGAFIQDDFRLTRRLTLNLGLRHEVFSPFVEMYDRQTNFDAGAVRLVMASPDAKYADGSDAGRRLRNTQFSNFGPRAGFAWTLSEKTRTVLRGGYGVFYNTPLTGGSSQMTRNPPFGISQSFTTALLPALRLQDGIPPLPGLSLNAPLSGNLGSTFDPNLKDGRGQNWNFNVQQQLGKNYLLEIAYVGSRGTRLLMNQNINQAPATVGVTNQDVNRPFARLAPALRTVTNVQSRGQSAYHAMQLKFTKSFSKNFMFLNSYTWGKAIDIASDAESSVLDAYNHRLDRGLSQFDVRHNLTSSWTYTLPFGQGQKFLGSARGVVNGVVSGWEISGIALIRSGLPFTVGQQQGVLSTGTGNRPNRVGSGKVDNPGPDRWFDAGAFVATPENTGTYGTAGRNILSGPGQVQFDFNLAKNTRITERIRHQLRIEMFNAFNHAQFANPASTIGTASAGVISSLLFGTPMRQMQIAMKVNF